LAATATINGLRTRLRQWRHLRGYRRTKRDQKSDARKCDLRSSPTPQAGQIVEMPGFGALGSILRFANRGREYLSIQAAVKRNRGFRVPSSERAQSHNPPERPPRITHAVPHCTGAFSKSERYITMKTKITANRRTSATVLARGCATSLYTNLGKTIIGCGFAFPI